MTNMKRIIHRVIALACALCLLGSGWEGGMFSVLQGGALAAPVSPGRPLYEPEGSRNAPSQAVIRVLDHREASWAYWEVRVNPDKDTLNGGSPLLLSDTFDTGDTDHINQSIDYASVAVASETAEGLPGEVSYDYGGQTGTFIVPDATSVTITYRTRIKAQPGEVVYLRGSASLRKGADGDELAAVTTEEGPFTIYPSASDVASTGARYMVKLFVYPEGQMQAGVPGASFILLDDNQRPMEYKTGPLAGQPVTFTTGSDGYVDVALSGEDGAAIEKNTAYYLEMKQAVEVDGRVYQKDNQLYSFMITDDPGYNSGGVYTYYNGDTMKVRLYPAESGLSVSLRFTGNYDLREDQQNAVAAVLQRRNGEDWTEVERHAYSESRWGAILFTTVLDPEAVYRVVEENAVPWDLPDTIRLTASHYCMVGTGSSEPYPEPQDFYVSSAGDSVNVVIDNRYEEPQLTVTKMDKNTGAALPGAKFGVYRIQGGAPAGGPVTTLTTDGDGMLLITGGEAYESEILYGIRETAAPQGYLLPQQEEWHYFYFCNDDFLIPTILADLPQGAAAFNLSETYDNVTVDNHPATVTVPVMKIWQGNDWPADVQRVEIGLYSSVGGSEPEPVLQDGVPRTVSLSAQVPYNNVAFANLPARDGDDRDVTYSIREVHVYDTSENDVLAQYVVEYGISDAGVYVVRNKPAASLTVSKQWVDGLGAPLTGEELAAQPSVTFDVYRTTATVSDEVRADGITDDELTAFLEQHAEKVREGLRFGSADGWTAEVPGLDLRNDQGERYRYYVLETIPSFGDEVYEASEEATPVSGSVTIRNETAPETAALTVTKAPLEDDPRPEAVDIEFTFTLKLQNGVHPIRSYTVYEDWQGNELTTDWNGEVSFTLLPEYADPAQQPRAEASITLSLPVGVTATVTETENPQYTTRTSSSAAGTAGDGGRSFSYEVASSPVLLTFTNTLRVVCMVVTNNLDEKPFESLKSALAYLRAHPDEFTTPWTVYMLEDYRMPASDVFTVQEGEELLLTTAMTEAVDSGAHRFHFHTDRTTDVDTAVITRFGEGGSLLKNEGRLTLEKICLDGAKDSYTATENGGLVYSTGTLELKNGTTLRSSASARGGAIHASGVVNIEDGAAVTGCSAPSGSAIYLAGGTLTMTGGTISGNSGAADGAVATANDPGIRVYLSGSPVIHGNTGSLPSAAANLSIGADSDQILNVVDPGLGAGARIGISAMEGHMEIGEQFATTEYGFYENLNGFINDRDGYRGKLKDGTSINVVWEGLRLTVEKAVAPTGADPDDRFTIILSSPDIKKSTYIINGTLDYAITAAREGRPGRIVLSNVKDGDQISISPLPVGDYTIAESSSNYAPVYTLRESGSAGTTAAEGGSFRAVDDCTVTVTNTRRLADVRLTKSLQDNLVGDAPVSFSFVLKLTEADGSPVTGFRLAEGLVTGGNGETSATTLSPTMAADAVLDLRAPVGATLTVTETVDPDYRIVASARTLPDEGEGADIADLDPLDHVFAFAVTDDGADLRFFNVRNMAEIELKKVLVGKVSKTESFTFTITLKNSNDTPAAHYVMYRDDGNNIATDENGQATITFELGENESEKSVVLTIPDGTKLVVEETKVQKTIDGTQKDIYNTAYSINGGASTNGTKATISSVSGTHRSIVFTNTRKTHTITVTNTVNGYSGNMAPFAFTAMVTDGGEDDYDANGFEDGMITFELAKNQTQTLTVPYGATLTVTEGFVVGYETTVKHGNTDLGTIRTDEFQVTANLTVTFTNNQLIGLRLVNNTSSDLTNVQVYVGYGTKMYRVNDAGDDQVLIPQNSGRWATLDGIEAGKTALLEIMHKTGVTDEQDYTVKGQTPADGYYYTIHNEPSFHETANPAILRVYDAASFEVKGKLRYSVADSTVTFTEQLLVSFDVNGGVWTTEMEDCHDRDGDRQICQMAVDSGETASRPNPDPIYPTAEGIAFLGWTADAAYARAGHTAGEDVSAAAYDFDAEVTAPVTLYAVWAKPARDWRVVTVRNGHTEALDLTTALLQNGVPTAGHALTDSLTTDASGEAELTIPAGESVNLAVPADAQLTLSLTGASLAVSSGFGLTASADRKVFTVAPDGRDGTVSFIAGICKITDGSGNILYDNTGKPAVYETLKEAFTAYNGTLYSDAAHTASATPAAVKLLVDEYAITEKHTFPTKEVILTTAGKDDAAFPYMGVRDRATLYRDAGFTGASCFALASATNTKLTNIVLDGRMVPVLKSVKGGLINVGTANAGLTISAGATLRDVTFESYDNNGYGGAVYLNNGTLTVEAGRFSNLHARRGGAIYAETNAQLSIAGSGIRFEYCDANDGNGDGGAIYFNNNNANLTINGGTDKDHPGIVFVSCVAKGATGSGGAIYVHTAAANCVSSVTVSGCSFTECSAKSTESSNKAGRGGGAISIDTGKENTYGINGLTVSHCSFTACDSMSRGGAIVTFIQNGKTVLIEDSSFEQCNARGQGGALAVYQPGAENETPSATSKTTKLSVSGCSFDACSSGTDNGSGGAIQSYVPCMEFTNSSFTDCWAGKEGGAVNNYFSNGYVKMWADSYMTLNGCSFVRCRAEDRYDPTAPQHYGGAVNTKVMTATVTDSYFEDCVSTLKEGGALHLGGQGTGSSASISGSTFKNCTAKNGGGAVLASAATLTIGDSFFYGCSSSASNGGAVYHYKNSRGDSTQNTTTITGCVFSADPAVSGSEACSTDNNGGAVWTRAGTVTISGCTFTGSKAGGNGGAVYLSKNGSQTATVTGGSVTGCQAGKGSAVYVEDQATFSGDLSVSGNTVTAIEDGAIHGGTLYFEGNVKVFDNTCSVDAAFKHDVLMQNDNLTTIQTTANGLEADAKIGVYVPDQSNRYTKYGLEGQKFGTFGSSDYLDGFFNDRDSELYGCEIGSNSYIYWGTYVCKITDAEGNTLTRTNGRDAIYQTLTQALDDFTRVTGGTPVYIKMLVENYIIRQNDAISNFPASDVTLTTAETTDPEHPYRGTDGTVCTVSRTSGTTQLFYLNNAGATFQFENITLDGRNNQSTETGNRRLIEANAGTLVINGGTTMQYGSASNGGAIYAAEAAQVTINGVYDASGQEPTVMFISCAGTGNNKPNGGAIRAVNLNIFSSTAETGQFGTAFINCSAYNGGAISVTGSTMEINGVIFSGCHSQSAGGAVYHNNWTANSSTTVRNSVFEDCSTTGNNWAHGGAVEARTKSLSVEACSFRDCQAASDGGAVYHGYVDGNNKPSGSRDRTSITNSTFTGCRTTGTDTSYNYGGSVYTQAVAVEVTGSSFSDSTASNHGGALYCQNNSEGSSVSISGTSFTNCSTTRNAGYGGAIYSNNRALTLEQSTDGEETSINACTAPGRSGAVYMETSGSALSITDGTVISGCYAHQGGAIYLKSSVTMNLSGSPEFTQNGYTTRTGATLEAAAGACIYLEEGSLLNLSGSPKFSRNILPNQTRITNGSILDNVRQDVYLAGYAGQTNATSIHVAGELTGDTIWVWPETDPHKGPNDQFATAEASVSAASLSHFRNALADLVTGCSYGEYLSGVRIGSDSTNVYWDKMYIVAFKKIDNKAVAVPGAGFTLYQDLACTQALGASAVSADGETDTDAWGNLMEKGRVEFASIPIGAYYMKETQVPGSFQENSTTYLVLVGTPYLSDTTFSKDLWEDDGPLNVPNAQTLVARHTAILGKYYGIFPLNSSGKAVLTANIAANNVGLANIRSDYQVRFMKVDGLGDPLPDAAFTVYTKFTGETFPDGFPKLERWSRDGESYPDPVRSADGSDSFKDVDNQTLPKGMVYFRELPLGTYYLLETAYPERNGSSRRTYYIESDRVFRLTVELEDENDPASPLRSTLSEWYPTADGSEDYRPLSKDAGGYYVVTNSEAVCKLTDGSDKLLYTEGHEIWERRTAEPARRLFPAIYPTLEAGFAAAQTEIFVDKDWQTVADNTLHPALKLQALKDLTLSAPVAYSSPRALTFTTARRSATSEDRYVFSTNRTRDTSRAEIRRGWDASAHPAARGLITVSGGADLTLQNINLNGQNMNGRAVHVTSGSLTVLNSTLVQKFRQTDGLGGAVRMESGTSLAINGGYSKTAQFSSNQAADGGALALGRDCTVSVSNAQFTNNTASGGGGAIRISASELSVLGSVFSNNTASDGGAVFTEPEGALTLTDSTLQDNSAVRGGAVHLADTGSSPAPASLLVVSGSIRDNEATASGGAVYGAEGSSVIVSGGTLQSNTAASGGAVYGAEGSSVTVSGGTLQSNTAALGSAIYGDDGAGITVTDAAITGNRASDANGGAINVGGGNARIRFGGSPTVFDNLGTGSGDGQQRNVVLGVDSNAIICTLPGGLRSDALIGVYATDAQLQAHGLHGMPFGTFDDGDPDRLNPGVFRNDRFLVLCGTAREEGDKTIYWNEVVCKLTADGGALLCQDVGITVRGVTKTYKAPAVYSTVQAGFDAAQGTLFSSGGSSFTAGSLQLKMLQDAVLESGITYTGSQRDVTFTTAETAVSDAMRSRGDYFKYTPGPGRSGAETALISRAFNGPSMISVSGSRVLTLTRLELDGGKGSFTATGDGGIVNVASGSLAVVEGAVLHNSASDGYGGAVYVADGASMSMSAGAINGNTAAEGAGVYLAQGSKLNLSGAPDFGGNGLEGDALVTVYSGGAPAGNFTTQSTFTVETVNGGKTYPRENGSYVARQDIFIAGYEGAAGDTGANSLAIVGDISSGEGTIWIWAEKAPRFQKEEQFATSVSGLSDDSLAAFRNSRPDEITGNSSKTSYLSGASGEVSLRVYWSGGGIPISFRKIDGFGNGVGGAGFKLYKDYDGAFADDDAKVVQTSDSATAAEAESDDTLRIGDVRFTVSKGNTYFLREMNNPDSAKYENNAGIYRLEVGEDAFTLYAFDGTAVSGPDLAGTGILNISLASRRVILRKSDDGYHPLKGAQFRIFRMDLTEVGDGYTALSTGIWFTGALPYGRYYLVETRAPTSPDGYSGSIGSVFKLEVSDSITIASTGNMVSDVGRNAEATESGIIAEFKEWFGETLLN